MIIRSIGAAECSGISKVNGADDLRTGGNDVHEDIPASGKRRDEYIPSEDEAPTGLYKFSEDKNGRPCIEYDDPKKGERSEKCTANTDKTDREIKKLREKARLLRQQLRSVSDDRRDELEKQLKAVETELSQKDNDSYRRENAVFM